MLKFIAMRLMAREALALTTRGRSGILAPGWNCPLMTVHEYNRWSKRLQERQVVYYSHDGKIVAYIFIFTNPADMWWTWGQFKKTRLANQDNLLPCNAGAEQTLSAALTHRYHLQLEDHEISKTEA